MLDPHHQDVVLHKLRIVPGSRLVSMVSVHVEPDATNGWNSLFFSDVHVMIQN
ncbi:hypothetical protein [Anaplasma phagocytophilum]|uniref:Uncharacterized protein n=1 Tax=Anaplasma phagocytophilum str. ApWI1 TaxID=1359155 RepID=A0A0F3PWM6_ANAPH|nr:hypothetical protein [Anaplasma phagocytophilum]AGR81963.1 hypothetical protein YYY_03530 [Anaplasma phagocytophilum str. Dog2]EOA61047.1 hypothetical protein HGE1_03277 [Anaplasma phagocytophilum str. HGE1]KJV83186.1 hypothetical protein APHHGE2_1050 [Anaplasma phagocytophilum str. HGE2]KJV84427.1 hypothetical protein APHWI1_0251 [Anaplasma phagocytophilum str. ApWI1]KJV98610.1 hypothetical protein OTSANNIE_1023 [Anaplasma phagocytophilum str. Annie]KJZ98441.1 hypothetical protein APHCR_0